MAVVLVYGMLLVPKTKTTAVILLAVNVYLVCVFRVCPFCGRALLGRGKAGGTHQAPHHLVNVGESSTTNATSFV